MTQTNTSWLSRLLGYTLILAAILGLAVSAWSLTKIWRVKGPFAESAQADLTLLQATLSATKDGLATASETLITTQESVASLVSTLDSVADSIEDTTPVIESLSRLIDADLPATILSTRRSIVSAQTSARLIDDILGSLTSIPLLGLSRYSPQVPLNVALGQVATSLAEIPGSLYEMEAGMEATRRNVVLIEIQIRDISYQVNLLNSSLEEASMVISSYETVLDELVARTAYIQTNLAKWVNSTVTFLTIILIWLAIAQLGLFAQGLDLIRGRPADLASPATGNPPTVEGK
jgi:methyl-accepting chemotaxis protein